MRAIEDVARGLGLTAAELCRRGRDVARIDVRLVLREPVRRSARQVLVFAGPGAAGGAESVVAGALATAAHRLGMRAVCTVPWPAGGAGAGGVQVPAPEVVDAVREMRDALQDGGRLVADASGAATGVQELAAVVVLARDRGDLADRLAVLVTELGAAEPVARLAAATPAFEPLLAQTVDGVPVLLHGMASALGPDPQVSAVAELVGMRCADLVVTPCPGGAVVGGLHALDVRCRAARLRPHVAVLVCDGAVGEAVDGVLWHVEALRLHGLEVVVVAPAAGPDGAQVAELAAANAIAHVASGDGEGLARVVMEIAAEPSSFRWLHPRRLPLRRKCEVVAQRVFGATGIEVSAAAAAELERLEDAGLGGLPVCVERAPCERAAEGAALQVAGVRVVRGAEVVVVAMG